MTPRPTPYDAANRKAAKIILEDPGKHEGIALVWAEAWTAIHPKLESDGQQVIFSEPPGEP